MTSNAQFVGRPMITEQVETGSIDDAIIMLTKLRGASDNPGAINPRILLLLGRFSINAKVERISINVTYECWEHK